MINFTLHFDMAEQCESLDRSWFGDMWFPVEKYVYRVQSSGTYDSIPDPADLDLEQGYSEPELCFSKSQVRDPAYALLDSGATHVLLPGHMFQKGLRWTFLRKLLPFLSLILFDHSVQCSNAAN